MQVNKWMAFVSFAALALHGAPVGNTAAPETIHQGFVFPCNSWIDFRLGYEGDFVSDGRMKQVDPGDARVDCYEQYTNSGTATINILDRMDLYGIFGASKTEANWRFETPEAETITRICLKTDQNFLWAFGSRVILFEWGNLFLGTGGRYSAADYVPSSLASNGVEEPVETGLLKWRQWQINFDLSYKIKIFTPYIGTKYSYEKAELNGFSVPISANPNGTATFENRLPVGMYLGCTISNEKYFMFNIEGRLIDEEAITLSADFRF